MGTDVSKGVKGVGMCVCVWFLLALWTKIKKLEFARSSTTILK